MVSSIVPGAAGASALGVDQRYARTTSGAAQQNDSGATGDRVDVSSPAAWSAVRDSVSNGLSQLELGIAAGRDAQSMLVSVQSASSQSDMDAILQNYSANTETAIAGGALLVGGGDISVQAEPGAQPVSISGADLRLGGGVISVANGASIDDPALQQNVQSSLDNVQGVVEQYRDVAVSLQAHQGFLGTVTQSNPNVRTDLDADGARLLALQVRQGLESAGGAIANAEPQAVLSLFKA
jgi:hypothetical protein